MEEREDGKVEIDSNEVRFCSPLRIDLVLQLDRKVSS